MLQYDVRRAFVFRYIYICPLVIAIIAWMTGLDSMLDILNQTSVLEAGWSIRFTMKVFEQINIQFILPVCAALPFSVQFVEEWKSGMIKNAVTRTNKRDYLLSKIVTTACSGGLVLSFSVLFLLGIVAVLFGGQEAQFDEFEIFRELLIPYIQLLCRYFCVGALWAELGLLISACLNHRLMAWLSPFIVYYLLIILCERYFPQCYVMYPREWITPTMQWPLEQWGVCLWLLFLTATVGYGFYRVGERALQNV